MIYYTLNQPIINCTLLAFILMIMPVGTFAHEKEKGREEVKVILSENNSIYILEGTIVHNLDKLTVVNLPSKQYVQKKKSIVSVKTEPKNEHPKIEKININEKVEQNKFLYNQPLSGIFFSGKINPIASAPTVHSRSKLASIEYIAELILPEILKDVYSKYKNIKILMSDGSIRGFKSRPPPGFDFMYMNDNPLL